MRKQFHLLAAALATLILLIIGVFPAFAQSQPVNAVLFYSPTCPHCEKVIDEVLPPLLEEYGANLNIIGINVAIQQGQELYSAAVDRFQIPEEKLGVPCLIVGDTVLVGSLEIPESFPGIIEDGIAQGGISLPDIPGLSEALEASGQANTGNQTQAGSSSGDQNIDSPSSQNPENIEEPIISKSSMVQKFTSDLTGNILSVIVLAGMIGSVIAIGVNFSKPNDVAGSTWPDWLIPVLAILGLGVAGYMTFVEVTNTQAVCGPVGNCNTVQQSPYATLFGILPVGAFGVAGYITILGVWLAKKFGPKEWKTFTAILLWSLALFGVLFSIYLTFLEPFVIGATCAWCLSTAVIMTLILWASSPEAKTAWKKLSRHKN